MRDSIVAGYRTTSCELSYYMSLTLRFILSPESTERVNQHRICPFSHWWSHQRSSSNTFREVSFPDVLPRRIANWSLVESDFLDLVDPRYDIIVTLFFLDTSSNIISYVRRSKAGACRFAEPVLAFPHSPPSQTGWQADQPRSTPIPRGFARAFSRRVTFPRGLDGF